jgi:hypothetical protein
MRRILPSERVSVGPAPRSTRVRNQERSLVVDGGLLLGLGFLQTWSLLSLA